ncbi:PPE domain-containing protein [Mycobacterium leprae]
MLVELSAGAWEEPHAVSYVAAHDPHLACATKISANCTQVATQLEAATGAY